MKQLYKFILTAFAIATSSVVVNAQTYCTPVYSFLCSSADYINNFSTTLGSTNITNNGSGCNGNPNNYIDYSATQILTVTPGNTFDLSVQAGTAYDQGFTVWIDYNDNGSFTDPGENVWNSGFASTSAFTGSITVPTTASGVTIMRVRCQFAGVPADPCASISFGETEDYAVVFCTTPAAPTVTSPVDACVNNTTVLNGVASAGTLNWYDVSTGGTSLGTGSSFTTPLLTTIGPDTFWVAAENGGCSSPRVPILVNVAGAVTVNLGADTTLCGTSFAIDAGNPGSSYLWSSGQGTQVVNVTTSGTYSVTLINPIGCLGSDVITVNLLTPPSYSLGADTTSCSSSVTLDAGSGYNSYSWSTGSTTQNTTVLVNDTVGVTVVDANGCVLNDTIIVSLSPAPSVNIGPDVTQCGGSVVLDAGNPGALYFWSNSTSSQTTTVSASGTYFVNVLTQAGCSGLDTVNITINNQPVVDLGADTSICLTSVILDAGNPGCTYLWSNSSTSQIVTVGTGTFSVTATDPSGCVDRDTISVTTNVPPIVSVSQDTAICNGGTATLNAYGASTYLWSNNATGSSLAVTPTTNTAYYVTGTDINGCQASDVVIVTILPSANAQFTASVSGATVNLSNLSTGAASYSWNFGDASPVNNSASPSHTYTTNGTYTITLTVIGVCGTDTYTQVVTISEVGVQDVDIANTLSIYPNPNNGQFTVSFEFAEQKDVRVELTDVSGRIVSSIEQKKIQTYKQQLGSESLANGVYFVRIATEDGVVTRKIIVQK